MSIECIRTPDSAFSNLPNWPYKPRYIYDLEGFPGLRLHYIDEGHPESNEVYLCLHGQPTWCYLYRKMIAAFLAARPKCRVIAPDLFGFGRSDKPTKDSVYTFDFHRNTLLAFVSRLNLKNITLVCQDWGGLLGLTMLHEPAMASRFQRLIVMNTALATGDRPLTEGFKAWRAYNNSQPDLNIGALMKRSNPHLTPAEMAAYAAPWPSREYKAGVRMFPRLVCEAPTDPGAAVSRQARTFLAKQWAGPVFVAVGAQDPVLGEPVMRALAATIRGCPPPLVLQDAGHFVQEKGEKVVLAALAHFYRNSKL